MGPHVLRLRTGQASVSGLVLVALCVRPAGSVWGPGVRARLAEVRGAVLAKFGDRRAVSRPHAPLPAGPRERKQRLSERLTEGSWAGAGAA